MLERLDQISARASRKTWILICVTALVLFGASFYIHVKIVVLRPSVGDISTAIGLGTQFLMVVATILSGILAYLSTSSDSDDKGPATTFEFNEGSNVVNLFFSGEQREAPSLEGVFPEGEPNENLENESRESGRGTEEDDGQS